MMRGLNSNVFIHIFNYDATLGHIFSAAKKINETSRAYGGIIIEFDGLELEELAAKSEFFLWKTQRGYISIHFEDVARHTIQILFLSVADQ